MPQKLQKLELTWIGKGEEPKLEPRILIEDSSKSLGDPNSQNMLIHGDNLLALKALEQDYAGKIKCIYIDPPYNTGNAFKHYDDGIEHSLWLSLIKSRLQLLWSLLNREGSIWISIDDDEMAYLKILLDEIAGRKSFVACIVWQKRYSRENREAIGDAHEYILVYSKDIDSFKKKRNKIPLGPKQLSVYKNPNNDPKGPWRSVSFSAQGYRPNQMYTIISPITGKKHSPPKGSCWKVVESEYERLLEEGKMYFGKDGNAVPARIQYLKDIEGIAPWTWWPHEDVGHTDEAKKEIYSLFGTANAFPTPKPERLIEQIIHISSNPNDLVLDSFLGSGTTAAVAHKMGRKWIGIELGEHAITHCLPRLRKVVSGEDKGGITEAVNWQGGGGFKFYTLAPSLIQKDKYGNEIINPAYNPNMLAAAMAKQEGFRYSPDENNYWKQGSSSEKDFVFTTTQFITAELLDKLHDEMQPGESLLICCKSFKKECLNRYHNITIKKIPQMLLGRCEFGKEDYSINVVNLPHDEDDGDDLSEESSEKIAEIKRSKYPKKKSSGENQSLLF